MNLMFEHRVAAKKASSPDNAQTPASGDNSQLRILVNVATPLIGKGAYDGL